MRVICGLQNPMADNADPSAPSTDSRHTLMSQEELRAELARREELLQSAPPVDQKRHLQGDGFAGST